MLTWIREKFGTGIIYAIISFIAFVFVFYGVFSPKATRGLHEGSVAGTVNGDAITIAEFNRELSVLFARLNQPPSHVNRVPHSRRQSTTVHYQLLTYK